MELSEDEDFSATGAHEKFTDGLELMYTPTKLRPERRRPPSADATRNRQCGLGELRRAAAVSRPEICARFAQSTAEVGTLQVGHT